MINRWMLLCSVMIGAGCGSSNESATPPFSVETLVTPAQPGSSEVHLAQSRDGQVVMSWLEDSTRVALRYATVANGSWGEARTVASGTDWFVNWADFPSVEPISGDLWAAHWLVKVPGGVYAYNVAVALSEDGGDSWSPPITPHRDATRTEHGFVTLFPSQSGVGALWLDGRNMLEDEGSAAEHPHGGGGMTLRSAVISVEQSLHYEQLIDELVCDCCQTDVALGPEGPVAVYRDRSLEEIRDISVARSVNGKWAAPITVAHDNWRIAGCPVNGPAIASDGSNLVVTWFTATAQRATRVNAAFSSDGGQSFKPAIIIDDARPMGRVDVVMLGDGDAVVSWLQRGNEGKAQLRVRRVSSSGQPGPMHTITETLDSRPSGFPQMARAGEYLLLAWTDVSGDRPQVRSVRLATAML